MSAPPSQSPVPSQPKAGAPGDDEINLSEYFDILVDNKWLVAAVTAAALVVGGAYAMLAKPVYQANLLIQVEDSAPDAKGFLGGAGSLFDVKTPSAGEIEIIRSRMVVGQAVDNTHLYISASPRYLPLVGNWLARRAKTLSDPNLPGLAGYVSGSEKISVSQFDVPAALEDGTAFTLTATGAGHYTLDYEGLDAPLKGSVGKLLRSTGPDGDISLLVTELDGNPGARFNLARASRLRTVEDLQKRLQLSEKGKQSNVINATLEDSDRARLTLILNEIGQQYVHQNIERKAAEAEKTLEFLDAQMPQFKKQMEQSEDAYTRFRNKNGTVALDEEANLVLKETVDLQTKLLETQQHRRELAARYTDINPKMQTVDAQIAGLNRAIGNLNNRVSGMPTLQQDALRLERDVRVNNELYKSLLNNSLQLRLVKEGKTGNVRMVDKAVSPKIPVKPQKSLILALALVLGLLGGATLAIVRSLFLRGIRSPQEIEAHTGLNVYSTIPLSAAQAVLEQRAAGKAPGTHLLALDKPTDLAIESLRSLRVALQFAMLEAANNRVLITGATPGVGKSFVSTNFAAIMAAAGKRVLLIDSDLRKGHIHQQFGLPRERGLSELVVGSLTPAQAIRSQVLPQLDLLTTGLLPPNPAELVMSTAFAQILDTLSAQYDLVIIDTPPVLVAADTAAIAPYAGTLLLVARAGTTQLGELSESARRLAQTGKSVSGVLFNAMDMTRRHYGRYGYKYGGYRYTQYQYQA